jgi:hypothetical protein
MAEKAGGLCKVFEPESMTISKSGIRDSSDRVSIEKFEMI